MVLCPFVFLMLRYDTPPLELQPDEVASTHWVSLRSLLSPQLRTTERADISDRVIGRKGPVAKEISRWLAGEMMFSAVRLKPSESMIHNQAPASVRVSKQPHPSVRGLLQAFPMWLLGEEKALRAEPPMLLWGLTLGIVADFLDVLDPSRTATLFSWPTFSHWDIRFFIWLLTRSFRSQRLRELDEMRKRGNEDESVEKIGGVDGTTYSSSMLGKGKGQATGIAGSHLLDGYFEQMQKAVKIALGLRIGASIVLLVLLVRRWRQQRAKL